MKLKAAVRQWSNYLLAEINPAGLVSFRIVFGLIMSLDMLLYLLMNRVHSKYIDPQFLFLYIHSMARPAPALLEALFAALAVAALFMAIGLFYRFSAWFFCLGLTYIFLLDRAQYLNHMYLMCLLSLLLAVSQAGHCFSLDNYLRKNPNLPVPRWNHFLLRFQLFVVYLYGAIWKLNPDWLRGEPQRFWFTNRAAEPFIGGIVSQEWFVWLVTYGGILTDFTLPFLLIFPRTFWYGVAIATFFHTTNSLLFDIGVFPWLMLGTIVLFPPPDWPYKAASRLSVWLKGPVILPEVSVQEGGQALKTNWKQLAALVFVHVYMIFHVVFPLRHFLYPGNVDWNEEGYYFAWRMMLHHKEAQLVIYKEDPASGDISVVDTHDLLTRRQRMIMKQRPELIHQFCVWLADREEKRTGKRPRITVRSTAALNKHQWQDLIDPKVDLGSEKFSLDHKSWIVDMKEEGKP